MPNRSVFAGSAEDSGSVGRYLGCDGDGNHQSRCHSNLTQRSQAVIFPNCGNPRNDQGLSIRTGTRGESIMDRNTIKWWSQAAFFVGGLGLMAVSTGCQTTVGGQTLPSAYFLRRRCAILPRGTGIPALQGSGRARKLPLKTAEHSTRGQPQRDWPVTKFAEFPKGNSTQNLTAVMRAAVGTNSGTPSRVLDSAERRQGGTVPSVDQWFWVFVFSDKTRNRRPTEGIFFRFRLSAVGFPPCPIARGLPGFLE